MKPVVIGLVVLLLTAACVPLAGTYMASSQAAILAEYCAQHTVSTPHVGPVAGTNNARYIWSQLLANGFTPEAAAGILGNLEQESNLNPTAVQDNGVGHGIAQWSAGGRWDTSSPNLIGYANSQGLDKWDLQAQLGFLLLELGNYGILEDYRSITDVMQATVTFHDEFERSGDDDAAVRTVRGGNAQEWFERLSDENPQTNTPTPVVSVQQPVFVVGDSLTVGTQPHLASMFESHGVKASIVAKNSLTTRQAQAEFDTKQAQRALTWIVATGTNDFDAKAFGEAAADLLNAARGRDVVWVNIVRPTKAHAINDAIAALAAKNSNVKVIDVAAAAKQHQGAFAADGIHMKSQQAYQWIAETYAETLFAAPDPNAVSPVSDLSPEDMEACAELGAGYGTLPLGSCDNYPAKLQAKFQSDSQGHAYRSMLPDAQLVIACVYAAFGAKIVPKTYSGHWGGFQQSIDFHIPGSCSDNGGPHTNTEEGLRLGTELTKFLSDYQKQMGVMYFQWQDHIRNPSSHSDEKQWVPISQWRVDNYNNGGCTNTHFDHVHTSVIGNAATGMKTAAPTPTEKAPDKKKEKAA